MGTQSELKSESVEIESDEIESATKMYDELPDSKKAEVIRFLQYLSEIEYN